MVVSGGMWYALAQRYFREAGGLRVAGGRSADCTGARSRKNRATTATKKGTVLIFVYLTTVRVLGLGDESSHHPTDGTRRPATPEDRPPARPPPQGRRYATGVAGATSSPAADKLQI